MSRRMQRPVVDLPQPDSPTRPMRLAGIDLETHPVDRVTRSTSRDSSPPLTGKCFTRSVTRSNGSRMASGTHRMQATLWPGPTSRRSGVARLQARHREAAARREAGSLARGSSRLGTTPGIASSRVFAARPVDARDRADQALRVGVTRAGEQLADRRLLDDLAGIHHHDALRGLGDDAHRVGDQHHRHAEPRFHLAEQIEDLRLDRRRRAPSSARRRSAASGCTTAPSRS